MTLLDRLRRDNTLPSNERVQGHLFEYAMTLYFHGHFTRQNIINFFNIPANFESDFDKFKTKYDSFTNNQKIERIEWLQDLEACMVGIQNEVLTKTQFNTILGLTLTE